MFDRELALELLVLLQAACERVIDHLEPLTEADDLLNREDGRLRLDAATMVLIAIGEQVKNIEKGVPTGFFDSHPEVDWTKAKAMRDRISHDYFGVNHRIVFVTVKRDIPVMLKAVIALLGKLEVSDSSS